MGNSGHNQADESRTPAGRTTSGKEDPCNPLPVAASEFGRPAPWNTHRVAWCHKPVFASPGKPHRRRVHGPGIFPA